MARLLDGRILASAELTAHFPWGLNVALDSAGHFVFGDFQIVAGLEVHPKGRAVSAASGYFSGWAKDLIMLDSSRTSMCLGQAGQLCRQQTMTSQPL